MANNEASYRSTDGRLTVKFNFSDNKDLFSQIAAFSEIYENNLYCKNCKDNNTKGTRLNVREVDGNKYYSRVCNNCGYSFSFGQKKKDGSLFPKHGDGWTKYSAKAEDHEEASPTKPKNGKSK
jgi:predicted nucleic-acid-binding Zn-ribbon protein